MLDQITTGISGEANGLNASPSTPDFLYKVKLNFDLDLVFPVVVIRLHDGTRCRADRCVKGSLTLVTPAKAIIGGVGLYVKRNK